MNRYQGFIEGLLLGSLLGATVVLLIAPASGAATRKQIGDESIKLKQRGQAYSRDRLRQAKNIVGQAQTSVADAQTAHSVTDQEQTP